MSSSPTLPYRIARKEEVAEILTAIRLYKHADVHLEIIANGVEPLVLAGFTHIRMSKKATANPSTGGSQTAKLARARQLPELTSTMNNSTVESQLDSWIQYSDGDLSQQSIARAVAKMSKTPRETESLAGKLALHFKMARERPDTDPSHFPKAGTEDEKEKWGACEARLWIEKVKPIYVEDTVLWENGSSLE